ncbi:hypothetical protein [Bacillus cereus]|uniref:Lipoprotein n=1 Tax=Bacillus cereus TaxID=1396 RepID=A0A164K6M0_BACCE|nr:hypothetical protein [Bacillus cereus]KZD48062.1 hypothetical protein B4088_6693 [Bacillus cereus]
MKRLLLVGGVCSLLIGCELKVDGPIIKKNTFVAHDYGKEQVLSREELEYYSPWKLDVLYQEDGYTQTYEKYGKASTVNSVYYQDDKGLYAVKFDNIPNNPHPEMQNEPGTKKNIISKVKKNEKLLIWKFDAKEGDTWKAGETTYKVLKKGYTLKGTRGTYKDVVVIEKRDDHKVARVYYSYKHGMVKTESPILDYDAIKEG